MTDLNLDGLPVLTLHAHAACPTGREVREELRQLVERERTEAFEAACAKFGERLGAEVDARNAAEQTALLITLRLPAWIKPLLRVLRKSNRTIRGFEYMTWYQLINAYDALSEEQKEEIERG